MSSRIARIKITLKGVKPPIWRRVDAPLEIDLRQLHFIIQDAMPWSCSHHYQFTIHGADFGDPYPDMDTTPMHDASSLKLANLVEESVDRFDYVYDFGDWWEHRIQVEKVLDAERGTKYPKLIGGRRQSPPEDIGGASIYQQMTGKPSNSKSSKRGKSLGHPGGDLDTEEFDMAEIQKVMDKETAKSLHKIFHEDW